MANSYAALTLFMVLSVSQLLLGAARTPTSSPQVQAALSAVTALNAKFDNIKSKLDNINSKVDYINDASQKSYIKAGFTVIVVKNKLFLAKKATEKAKKAFWMPQTIFSEDVRTAVARLAEESTSLAEKAFTKAQDAAKVADIALEESLRAKDKAIDARYTAVEASVAFDDAIKVKQALIAFPREAESMIISFNTKISAIESFIKTTDFNIADANSHVHNVKDAIAEANRAVEEATDALVAASDAYERAMSVFEDVKVKATTPTPATQPPSKKNKSYFVKQNRATWDQALDGCRNEGMTLASIESPEDQMKIEKVIRDSSFRTPIQTLWIGAWDNHDPRQGGYRWVGPDGAYKPLTYQNWKPHQPDHLSGRKNCVDIHRSDGKWNDIRCNYRKHYVCESYD